MSFYRQHDKWKKKLVLLAAILQVHLFVVAVINLFSGDNLDHLRQMDDNTIDAIVTDPPYGISFAGKKWDYDVPSIELWQECLRVLKPGGHALIACGTRTQHRMVCNIEDAGFEIRDVVSWLYGSGFPKSLDVSKAIDKQAGADREVVGWQKATGTAREKGAGGYSSGISSITGNKEGVKNGWNITGPATDEAKQWEGWGTALKPACEFFTLCRKPIKQTVAHNVLKWGTGAINIDGCRVGKSGATKDMGEKSGKIHGTGFLSVAKRKITTPINKGRWPANVIHDGSDQVLDGLRENARFFYCPKACPSERDEGNIHPTVKPVELMRYLVRLITPPRGTVMDPFMGSGTTGVAAKIENMDFVGMELSAEYFAICERRIQNKQCVNTLF